MEDVTFIAGALIAPVLIGAGMSASTAGIVSGLVGFVLAAGMALLSALLAPAPPKPDDVKQAVSQTVPPRNFCYGRMRVSGYFLLRVGLNDDALYTVQALVSHRINEFVFFYFNDDQIDPGMIHDRLVEEGDTRFLYGGALEPGAFGYPEWDGRYGNDRVFIDWRFGRDHHITGLPDEYNKPYFISENDVVAPFYPLTSLAKGIASICTFCRDAGADEQAKRFPYGAPEHSAVIEGYFLYDPRIPACVLGDEDTYVYSTNPVLAIIHWLCLSEFGYQRDYAEAILPLESEWKAQADICDENVPVWGGGGSIKRYSLGGYGTTDNDPKDILSRMLMTCDGWIAERGDGVFVLRVGKWQPSGITLDYLDIKGFSYQRGFGDEDAVNEMDVTFTSPSHDWSETECDPWIDEVDLVKRGRERAVKYQLEWCQDFRQARRLAKREFKRVRDPVRGSFELRLSGINAAYERFIYIGETQIPGLSNRYIENRACRIDLVSQTLHMEFWGTDPSIDDWDATVDADSDSISDDEGVAPPVIPRMTEGTGPEMVSNLSAYTENFTSGGATAQRIVCEFDKPPDEFINQSRRTYRIRYRAIDTDPGTPGDQPGDWTDETHNENPVEFAAGTRLRLKTGAVEADQLLEVEMATVSSGGSVSPWCAPVDVVSGTPTGNVLTDASSRVLRDAAGGNVLVDA